MKVLLVVIGLASALPLASAEQPGSKKDPWMWTDEERIAERLNPEGRKKRSAPEGIESAGLDQPSTSPPRVIDVISGNRNPELFLGPELFNAMIRGAFNPDVRARPMHRRIYARALGTAPLPERFWERMEVLAAPLIQTYAAMSAAGEVDDPTAEDVLFNAAMKGICPGSADGLALAREEFGSDVIDVMLYRGVAPGHAIISFDQGATRQDLENILAGCR